MLEILYPGLTGTFDLLKLTAIVTAMQAQMRDLRVQWLKSEEPATVFGKPGNPTPSPKEQANHVRVMLNNKLVFESYRMKIGAGKIFLFDENMDPQREELMRGVLTQNQLKVPGKGGKMLTFLAAGIHVFVLFIVTIIGLLITFGAGEIMGILLLLFGGAMLMGDILGIALILIGQYGTASTVLRLVSLLTTPSGLLLTGLADYAAGKARGQSPASSPPMTGLPPSPPMMG